MISAVAESLRQKARVLRRHIALADATDERVLSAAQILVQKGLAYPLLIGKREAIERAMTEQNFSPEGITICDPSADDRHHALADMLYQRLEKKGVSRADAYTMAQNPLYFAGMLVKSGDVSACVSGSLSTTANVVRAGLRTVGLQEGISVVSSQFLMIYNQQIVAFADCAVVPQPTPVQLADIAIVSADYYKKLTGVEPIVAMLSFATRGSAEHEDVTKVRTAVQIAKEKAPHLQIDGELQFDAAFVPHIAARKAPDSVVAGRANVYVFPDLDAGNIAYKIAERWGGAEAIGPIIQGLQKPYLDLSRGCSVDDIVTTSAIGALLSL
jgi:phosphate acetyltransferase